MARIKRVDRGADTANKLEFFYEQLCRGLPAIFARHKIGELTGGALHPRTLANLMSESGVESPPSFKVGRTVTFERSSFLEWLRNSGRVKINK
jgi:hypothetical protein